MSIRVEVRGQGDAALRNALRKLKKLREREDLDADVRRHWYFVGENERRRGERRRTRIRRDREQRDKQ